MASAAVELEPHRRHRPGQGSLRAVLAAVAVISSAGALDGARMLKAALGARRARNRGGSHIEAGRAWTARTYSRRTGAALGLAELAPLDLDVLSAGERQWWCAGAAPLDLAALAALVAIALVAAVVVTVFGLALARRALARSLAEPSRFGRRASTAAGTSPRAPGRLVERRVQPRRHARGHRNCDKTARVCGY